MSTADLAPLTKELSGKRVTVAGLGLSGLPAAKVLHRLGAHVTAVNGGDGEGPRRQAAELEHLGISVRLGDDRTLPEGTDLVVTTPGFKPASPLFRAAAAADVPVWGDVELAWRLRGPDSAPWLAVTGTNGKTTTVQMLASILTAAGLRTAAVGNIGVSLIDVVLEQKPYDGLDVLAVELSSYQLHWAPSLRPHSAAVLNLAPDHLDWHGSMEAYAADKGRIYEGNEVACVYNADASDRAAGPTTEDLVREADVVEGARAIGFTLATPGPSQLGVVDGILVDRAFVYPRDAQEAAGGESPPTPSTPPTTASAEAPDRPRRTGSAPAGRARAQELAETTDVRPAAPHNIANALAAAALARAYGVPAAAVRDGLRAFRPDAHRIAHVADVEGVAYVNDSKATNTHAAEASLAAYDPIVWIAGGLAKGATFDDLVRGAAPRLRGVVLMGADRHLIREALARHAPDVPVADIEHTDTGAMAEAVRAARSLAQPGDTVLLAPACASMDMFVNYNARGDAFAEAVTALAPADARNEQ